MTKDYEQGKTDLAEQIYAILKTHKNSDNRDLLEILKKYLKLVEYEVH